MSTRVQVPLGVRLAWWREGAGMSRTELARRLGLKDPSAVSHWEKGRNEASIETLTRIAVIVGARTLVGFLSAKVPSDYVPRVIVPRRHALKRVVDCATCRKRGA